MAYTLNTSHPLYANLVELIGVQSGALVSHKTARVFTVDAAASFGSGVWGEHFHAAGGGYTNRGASFSPAIGVNTTSLPNYTVVTILNSSGANENSLSLSNNTGSSILRGPGLSAGQISAVRGGVGATNLGTTQHMLAYCRIGETSYKMYVDNGVLDYSTTSAGASYNDPATSANYIGAVGGGGNCSLDIVWAAVFNKELSQAEIQSLYGSLGADNAFGLVNYGGTGTDASGSGGTGTSTGSGSGGSATGNSAGTGSFTFPAGENNTHSGALSGVVVNWAWHSGGAVGAASVITNGTGTLTTGGMTISGLPTGVGYGVLRSSDGTVVGYREGTVS